MVGGYGLAGGEEGPSDEEEGTAEFDAVVDLEMENEI